MSSSIQAQVILDKAEEHLGAHKARMTYRTSCLSSFFLEWKEQKRINYVPYLFKILKGLRKSFCQWGLETPAAGGAWCLHRSHCQKLLWYTRNVVHLKRRPGKYNEEKSTDSYIENKLNKHLGGRQRLKGCFRETSYLLFLDLLFLVYYLQPLQKQDADQEENLVWPRIATLMNFLLIVKDQLHPS